MLNNISLSKENMTPEAVKFLSKITNDIRSYPDEELDKYSILLKWTSYDESGKERKMKSLCELDTEHLENILITQRHISLIYSRVILYILKKRYGRQ